MKEKSPIRIESDFVYYDGASGRIWTDGKGVAVPGLTTWLRMRDWDYRRFIPLHQDGNRGQDVFL